jgi:2'-5' RNA ligase
MSLLRVFIALDIPANIQHAIHEATGALRSEIGSLVKWVPCEGVHLTLKFLGAVSPAGIESLTHMLRTQADLYIRFEILIGGLGSFPNLRRPRVIIVGIKAPAGLEALYRGIEAACTRLGYESETRGFSPHLTIGRVSQSITPQQRQKIRRVLESSTIDSLGTARVDSVQLYRSDLNPDGAVYTRLFSAPFKS